MEHPAPPTRHTAEVSWPDVSGLVPHIMALDGLTYLRQVRDGRLPGDPFMEMLGFRVVAAPHPGRLRFAGGRVQRAGKRVGHVRAEIHDAGGRLLCTGASTHAVVAHDFWQR